MNIPGLRYGFLLTCAAAALLSACNAQSNRASPPGGSEDLLKSDAVYEPGEEDPVAAHLAARQQVDPKDTRPSHKYTTKPTAEEIDRESNTRMVNLENQVSDLRGDFKNVILPGIDDKKPIAPKPVHVSQAPGSSIPDVMGVRIGEHPDKTRIVLDVSAPAQFSLRLNAQGTVLSVDLPGSTWSGAAQQTFGGSPMLKSYTAMPSASGGVSLVVELKKPAKLLLKEALKPNDVYGTHRIVFDVAPL